MLKNKLLQTSLAGFATLAFSPISGVAIAHENNQHQNNHQHNNHQYHDRYACYEYTIDTENTNDILINNTVDQNSRSGEVIVERNTTVGDVRSGSTSNAQSSSVAIEIDNSTATQNHNSTNNNNRGNNSGGEYVMEVTSNSENNIEVMNSVTQTARSGDVTVHHNTTVGDVTSGSATNTSTSTISISTR